MIPFEELVKLHNTVMLVSNDWWRTTYQSELGLVWAVVWGYVDDLTPKGWEIVVPFYQEVLKASPMCLNNPGRLPVL